MRRRILIAILSVTTVAVVLFGVPLAIVVDRFVDEEATLGIEYSPRLRLCPAISP
jgi:hypothetical protein